MERPAASQVERRFACIESVYWSGNCTLRAYMTLFLAYQGLSDGQIGYTASLVYLSTIGTQLVLSNYADKHPASPLKRIILALFLAATALAAMMFALPLPALLMMVTYVLCTAFDNTIDSMLNALFMQHVNNGVPARYGWPRGVGSICYAATAYVVGLLIERFSPNAILPVLVGMCVLGMGALFLMPDPGPRKVSAAGKAGQPSYLSMLKGNPTLCLLLLACIISGMGQCSGVTYLIRIVERLGGNSVHYGITSFIQAGVELPMMFASGWLLKRFSSRGLLTVSFCCCFLKIFFMGQVTSLPMLYLVVAGSMFCFGIYGFSSVLFVNSIAGEQEKVRAQSLLSLCYTGGIGGILGNLLGGSLIDVIGLDALFTVSSCLCLAGAVVMVLCSRQYQKQFHSI